jgi:squalene cyclase
MKKKLDENNVKKFSDFSNKSWLFENDTQTINVADSALKLMKNEATKIEVKEILYGDPWQTWRIIIDNDDKFYLLKTSKELK